MELKTISKLSVYVYGQDTIHNIVISSLLKSLGIKQIELFDDLSSLTYEINTFEPDVIIYQPITGKGEAPSFLSTLKEAFPETILRIVLIEDMEDQLDSAALDNEFVSGVMKSPLSIHDLYNKLHRIAADISHLNDEFDQDILSSLH